MWKIIIIKKYKKNILPDPNFKVMGVSGVLGFYVFQSVCLNKKKWKVFNCL